MRFGATIRARRKELHKTQAQVARCLGISKPYYSDIERGNRFPRDPDFIEALARALDLPSDYVYWLAGRVPRDIHQDIQAGLADGTLAHERILAAHRVFLEVICGGKA